MKNIKFLSLISVSILCLVLLSSCGKKESEEIDPHAGQVYVYDGYDYTWMTPLEGVERNVFTVDDFEMVGDIPIYNGSEYSVKKGIDVSEFQHEINWQQTAENIDFAVIRCGYRGYTEGGLHEDIYFRNNMAGASDAGLDIGIYFTTQAINVSEALEEAEYVLDLIKDYNINLPIFIDWERNYTDEARAENLDVETLTNCTIAFCEKIKNAGYEVGVYYNRTIGYYRYDLSKLTQYKTWFSLPVTPPDVTYPSFLYKIDYWQYSISGSVPGVPTEVDLDYIFLKN